MKEFYVIKKSAKYAVKTLPSEEKARDFASECCRVHNNNDYFVATIIDGRLKEI